MRRHGSTEIVKEARRPTRPPLNRFRAFVTFLGVDDCWEWGGSRNANGYGQFFDGARVVGAHRWSYEHFVGPIPDGLGALHKCDNPPCVNPAHLFLGNHVANVLDSVLKDRRARPHGRENGRAKLAEEEVVAIRSLYTGRYGNVTHLSRIFGVGRTQIVRVARGEQWQSVAG